MTVSSGPLDESDEVQVGDAVFKPPSSELHPIVSRVGSAGDASRGSDTRVDAWTGQDSDVGYHSGEVAPTPVKTAVEPMVAVYRHDVYKARMQSHENASKMYAGVRVNEKVPRGADDDAALLSRPHGELEQTVANHELPFRNSLVTGGTATKVGTLDDGIGGDLGALVQIDDPEEMHTAWLSSSVAAIFNESGNYPYTSLKYHTLLAAALLDNYRAGYEFADLFLVVDSPDTDVIPHRTVLMTPTFKLRLTGDHCGRPAAQIGDRPVESFDRVWSRLPVRPFDADSKRLGMVLDSQLRRIRSWSTALQFIEEFLAWWQTVKHRKGGGSRVE